MSNKITKIILICSVLVMVALTSFVFNGRKGVSKLGFSAERDLYRTNQQNYLKNNGKTSIKNVKVFITGEVRKPGVYDVPASLRVSEVIKVAGGVTDAAKVEGVNLTRIVRDGMQINVPALKKNEKKKILNLGEKKQRERSFKRTGFDDEEKSIAKGAFVEVVPMQAGVKISLGTATIRELITLPGIHEELARRIIAYREKYSFKQIEDLLKVKGIRKSVYKKLKDKVSL